MPGSSALPVPPPCRSFPEPGAPRRPDRRARRADFLDTTPSGFPAITSRPPAGRLSSPLPPDRRTTKRCLIYAHRDVNGFVDPYVIHALRSYRPAVDRIVFVSTHYRLRSREPEAVAAGIIVRGNVGFDFQSWREGLELVDVDAFVRAGLDGTLPGRGRGGRRVLRRSAGRQTGGGRATGQRRPLAPAARAFTSLPPRGVAWPEQSDAPALEADARMRRTVREGRSLLAQPRRPPPQPRVRLARKPHRLPHRPDSQASTSPTPSASSSSAPRCCGREGCCGWRFPTSGSASTTSGRSARRANGSRPSSRTARGRR